MKTKPSQLAAVLFLLGLVAPALSSNAATLPPPDSENTLLIEPETFNALGAWQRTGNMIQSANMPAVAFAGFHIAEPGEYQVWTRSRDYPTAHPGSRRCLIKIDEVAAARESGQHGQDGFYWEMVGRFTLAAGTHLIEIDDTARYYARLESILITRANLDPNTVSRTSLDAYVHEVVQPVRTVADAGNVTPPADGTPASAELRNNDVAIRFLPILVNENRQTFWRETRFLKAAAGTQSLASGIEPLLLVTRGISETAADFDAYFPSWTGDSQTSWQLEGRTLTRPADPRDPFCGGKITKLLPVSLRAIDALNIEITYQNSDGTLSATATWTLPQNGHIVRIDVALKSPKDAYYSLAFGPGPAFNPDNITAVQLPPLYQMRRLPEAPLLITSSRAPHPLALIEQDSLVSGVFAAPETLTKAYATRSNASHGFSLVGADNLPRPYVFTPLLGGENSRVAKKATLRARFAIAAAPLAWEQIMREADADLFQIRDYREPVNASLTTQALNMIALLADEQYSWWYSDLKGPSNIESAHTATHAAPLAYLSAARLTRNVGFYKNRALPTVEFMLSRPSAHFALSADDNLYVTERTARIDFTNIFFSSAVWQGVDDLLGGLNPWLRDYATRDELPISPTNNSSEPQWSGYLALYRQNPTPELLEKTLASARSWIQRTRTLNDSVTRGLQPFYNVSFYPYWWDLLDLYEISPDSKFLETAIEDASLTVAGQWVHPILPKPGETQTLYPGNKYTTHPDIWWLGNERGRTGWTADMLPAGTKGNHTFNWPEKEVPAWLASPVGLGLEQPISYNNAYWPELSHIMMSSWAANLLRLSGITGDDYWRIFARNSIIGRGDSYPGYYLSNYTDIMHNPDYPKHGPDVTSFYWHHIPPHLALVLDFLFTDAEQRTQGAVRFPYSKQQGYVWFSNRAHGGKPGKIFDDENCWPWLDRCAFNIDTPKVDYIGARSAGKFHIVLLNQAQGASTARVNISAASTGTDPDANAQLRDASGNILPLVRGKDGSFTVQLEQGAWAVLSLDARQTDFWPVLPPLETKPAEITPADSAWGEGRAFRIRSPHGFDSLYVVLSGKFDGGKVTLIPEGEGLPQLSVDRYPYELSLPDIPLHQNLRFRLRLERPGQAAAETPLIELPGTPEI